MKIINKYPPNYNEIEMNMRIVGTPAFPYGDIIYNPHDREIPPDVHYHEYIHSIQQGDNPALWWSKYTLDRNFRLEQEIEAYAHQYKFVKEHLGDKVGKEALDGVAEDLASDTYSFGITKQEAETAIRKYAKEVTLVV